MVIGFYEQGEEVEIRQCDILRVEKQLSLPLPAFTRHRCHPLHHIQHVVNELLFGLDALAVQNCESLQTQVNSGAHPVSDILLILDVLSRSLLQSTSIL